MNITEYTYLLTKSDEIQSKHSEALEKVIEEFPYFQSARALQLKGLFHQNSFKYNNVLKTTAAYTTDRSVLFDFITSATFVSIPKSLFERKENEILEIAIVDSDIAVTDNKTPSRKSAAELSILTSIKEATSSEIEENELSIHEKLAIGTPLDFTTKEQHSFQEWLQLSRSEPIEREKQEQIQQPEIIIDDEKRKKLELIDKFIESSPKISPVKHGVTTVVSFDLNATDNSSLMTETLARVYLEQKKYQKAIQAYEILILKYPEKSSFFADRISDIKILQHNNN